MTAWGAGLRRVQSGYVVNYAPDSMLAGAVVVIAFLLAR